MLKKEKRGVGQPRKYKPDKCPHCGSHWHTGNGKGREKCNECKRTWAIAPKVEESLDVVLATPTPTVPTEKEAAPVHRPDQSLAA